MYSAFHSLLAASAIALSASPALVSAQEMPTDIAPFDESEIMGEEMPPVLDWEQPAAGSEETDAATTTSTAAAATPEVEEEAATTTAAADEEETTASPADPTTAAETDEPSAADADVTEAPPAMAAPVTAAVNGTTNTPAASKQPAPVSTTPAASKPLTTSFSPFFNTSARTDSLLTPMSPETYNPNGGMGIFQLNNGVNVHAAALSFQDPVIASGQHLGAGAWVAIAVGAATVVSAVALLTMLVRHKRHQKRTTEQMLDEGACLLSSNGTEKISLGSDERVVVDNGHVALMAGKESRPFCQVEEDVGEPDFLWNPAASIEHHSAVVMSQRGSLEGEMGQFV